MELTYAAGEFHQLAVSQQVYFRMPTDIQQLRRENSYGAIVGGKGLVKLRHLPANARVLLHQMHGDAHVTQVERSLYSRDSTADNQNFR
jgi:hypothetical protein